MRPSPAPKKRALSGRDQGLGVALAELWAQAQEPLLSHEADRHPQEGRVSAGCRARWRQQTQPLHAQWWGL
jgi:hypothetical protein